MSRPFVSIQRPSLYLSAKAFSRGRRLDEGEIRKAFILFSSPQPSPAGEGAT